MRFKQMSRWTFINTLKGYGVFWGIYMAIMIALSIFVNVNVGGIRFTNSSGNMGTSGSAAVFMLIFGIVGFSMYLRVGFANGVSRKTVFLSNIACFAAVSVIAALGEMIVMFIASLIMGLEPAAIFTAFSAGTLTNPFADWLVSYLLTASSLLAAAFFGLFIGSAFYRMSKIAKILVSVFGGIFFFFGIPALAIFSQVEFLQVFIMNVLVPIFNFFTGSVWASMLGYIIMAAVFMLCTWLCTRKAPAKAAK